MSEPTPNIVAAMHELLDQLGPVSDAVDGYRAQCITRGYSPTAAESMAMDLHAGMMRMIFTVKAAT